MLKMNRTLLAPRVETGGNLNLNQPKPDDQQNKPVTPSPEEEIALLKAQLSEANQKLAKAGVSKDIEPMVAARMRMGLSREDAIVCSRRHVLSEQAIKEADSLKPVVVMKEIEVDGKMVKVKDEAESKKATAGQRNAFLADRLVEAGSAA